MDELKLTSHHIPSPADYPPEGQKRFKLVIEYDGTAYSGWQRQINGPSVQQTLEEALARLTGEKISAVGSSRTDAGVHALGQCAHFDTSSRIPPEKYYKNIDRYGNTAAASVPLVLSELVEQGRVGPGSRLLLTAFGGGLTWGGAVLEMA